MSEVRLKDVTLINNRTLSESTDPDFRFRYIDIGSVDEIGNISVPESDVSFSQAPSRARRIAPVGSTVVSTVRTYLRAVAYVPKTDERLVFSTGFAVLEPRAELDSRYLYYYCRSEPFIQKVVAHSVGVSYPAINASDIGHFRIAVPPLEEQRRIADFLDATTTAITRWIELRRLQQRLLDERIKRLITYMYSRAREEHGTIQIRHIIRRIEQGWSPECENRRAGPNEWGIVKAGCVNGGIFHPEENKALPSNLKPRREYELHEGDLLMSRASGSLDLIGSVAVVQGLKQGLLLCDKVYRIKLDERSAVPRFVAHMMQSIPVRDQIRLGVSGASGLASNIPNQVVREVVVPLPPIQRQEELANEIDHEIDLTNQTKRTLDRQLELLAERRRALITAAVTGQLDVTTARGVREVAR